MKPTHRAMVLLAALLAALVALPPLWHLPAGAAVWVVLRGSVPDVHRAIGRPLRWMQVLVVLCLLGALLGPTEHQVLSVPVSQSGALSGATMVVRAFALIALASLASSVLPLRRWARNLRHPLARRLIEVVVIASNLVPVQLRALSTSSAALRERRPGLARLPKRLWLLSVHSSVRAAMLAENVAWDMAIATHNSAAHKEKSS
ncbi:MAG: hypothetical protein ACOC1F_04780 [Myxococcota bacterium]